MNEWYRHTNHEIRLDRLSEPWVGPLATALLSGAQGELLEPLSLIFPEDEPPQPRSTHRDPALLEGLLRANRAYGHPAADALCERLAGSATQVVITGQQCGLFGGPLYTLVKALGAVAWAEALEARGQKAVACFWMASDDHDFREAATSFLPPIQEEPTCLGEDQEPLRSVGSRSIPQEALGLRVEGSDDPADPYGSRLQDCLERMREERQFTSSFARYLVDTLGDRCPILVDSALPELKAASQGVMSRAVERRQAVDKALLDATERVEAAGHKAQVGVRSGDAPFFVAAEDGSGCDRRRVVWVDEGSFARRGCPNPPAPVSALQDMLRHSPQRLSPGVLLRPAVQDAVFGTSILVLGPGELQYMAQAASVYRELDIEAPRIAVRPHVCLLDSKRARILKQLVEDGVPCRAVLGSREELDAALAGRFDLSFLEEASEGLETVLGSVEKKLMELDRQLEKPMAKTRSNIERSLEMLRSKTTAAAARRDETLRSRVERVRSWVRPAGRHQERSVSCAHYTAHFGAGLAAQMAAELDLDPRLLQLLVIEADA